MADLTVGKVIDSGVDNEDEVSGRTKSSGQRVRHYEIVGLLLKERMEEKLKRFKEVMKVREEVIKELARRRKELLENDSSTSMTNNLNGTTGVIRTTTAGKVGLIMPALIPKSSSSSKTKITSQLQSPLFTSRTTKIGNGNKNTSRNEMACGSTRTHGKSGYGGTTTTGYGYGGGYNAQGVGSGGNTGLRQRPTGNGGGNGIATSSSSYNNNNNNYTSHRYGRPEKADDDHKNINNEHADQQSLLQIQERRTMRRTKDRLRSARQAEAQLADLTGMFGKMSELIHSQGETLEKIEDDVEAGHEYINAGVEEIGKLQQIKKGNRSLIVKVFAILIFFIIAMRWF